MDFSGFLPTKVPVISSVYWTFGLLRAYTGYPIIDKEHEHHYSGPGGLRRRHVGSSRDFPLSGPGGSQVQGSSAVESAVNHWHRSDSQYRERRNIIYHG